MRAIFAIASTTVGEAIRRRVLLIILLLGLAFLIIVPGLSILSPRSEKQVAINLTLGAIQMTSALIAVILTIFMIPNEIERRTIYTILSKPVQRWQFVIGKYLGAVAALGMMIGLMLVVLLAVSAIQFKPFTLADAANLAYQPLMYFFQMSLLAAVAILFSTFVTPLVNFFLSSGTFIAGTTFSTLFQTLTENRDTAPIIKSITWFVQFLLPNFGRFAVQNQITNPGQEIVNPVGYFVGSVVYSVTYIGAMIALACIIFDRREV